MLLDAGSTLAADHTLVHRVIAIAFDIFDSAIFEIDFDPAPAGAHVTGCGLDLVPCFGRTLENGRGGHWQYLPSKVIRDLLALL